MAIFILLLFALTAAAQGPIPSGTSAPPTPCTVGDQYIWLSASDSQRMLFVCTSSGWQQQGNVGNVTAADLASPLDGKGADQVAYAVDGTKWKSRTVSSRLRLDDAMPQDYIAKECPDTNIDGTTSRPLSNCFSTLADAQAVYPFVTSLTDELAWAAIQQAVNSKPRVVIPGSLYPGTVYLISNKLSLTDAGSLAAAGGSVTLRATTANAGIAINTSPASQKGYRYAEISGITVDGNNVATTCWDLGLIVQMTFQTIQANRCTENGIRIDAAQNNEFHNTYIDSNTGRGLSLLNGAANVRFYDTEINGTTGTSVYFGVDSTLPGYGHNGFKNVPTNNLFVGGVFERGTQSYTIEAQKAVSNKFIGIQIENSNIHATAIIFWSSDSSLNQFTYGDITSGCAHIPHVRNEGFKNYHLNTSHTALNVDTPFSYIQTANLLYTSNNKMVVENTAGSASINLQQVANAYNISTSGRVSYACGANVLCESPNLSYDTATGNIGLRQSSSYVNHVTGVAGGIDFGTPMAYYFNTYYSSGFKCRSTSSRPAMMQIDGSGIFRFFSADSNCSAAGDAVTLANRLTIQSDGSGISSGGPVSGSKFRLSFGSIDILSGNDSPEGAVAGNVGSVYLRANGLPGATMYVKETGSGTTGWRQFSTSDQPVTYKTSDYALTDADRGVTFTNSGATNAVTFTTYTTTARRWNRFCVDAAQSVTVAVPSGTIIQAPGATSASGGNVTSNQVGACVELQAISSTKVIGVLSGNWTVN